MVNKVHTKTYKWKESVFFFKGGGDFWGIFSDLVTWKYPTSMEAISNVLSTLKTLKSFYHAKRIHEMLTPCCWKHSLTPVVWNRPESVVSVC